MTKPRARRFERLIEWMVKMLTRLFGRTIEVEGGRPVKLLAIVFGKRVYLFGGEDECLQLDFTSQNTLRIRRVPEISLTEGRPVDLAPGAARTAPVHVVLAHLPAAVTDPMLEYTQRMGPAYDVVLAHGGKEEDFNEIRFDRKIFVPDPKLRGLPHDQSYFGVFRAAQQYLQSRGLVPEWIFFGEYDLLPLRPGYLDEAIALAERERVGFAAKLVDDVSRSNMLSLIRAIERGKMETLPGRNGPGRGPVFHCLGACLLFHRSCLEAVLDLESQFEDVFFEIAVPTAAAAAGFRVLSFDRYIDTFRCVRYRPFYSSADAVKLAGEKATLLHPIKESSEFIRQASDLPGAGG